MRLILVRHGASWHALHGLISVRAGCAGLTELAARQAAALAERLRRTREAAGCAALLASPVPRAWQTAELIRPALKVDAIVGDPDLCELDPGQADGMERERYRQEHGEFDLLAFPERPFASGGESWRGFLERVRATLERLAASYRDQTVVAVSHAGFIMATLLVLFDIPRPGSGTWLDPANAALTEWEYLGHSWRLVRYNDSAHCGSAAAGLC